VTGRRLDDGVDDVRVRSLLVDSLALWQVDAVVAAPDSPATAVIVASDGTQVWIERPGDDGEFRWIVRSSSPGETGARRPRPCTSLVGMLNATRRSLGVDVGEPLRIMATGAKQ